MDAVSCPGCLERDLAIAELRALVAAQQAQIVALQAEVAALGRKLDERPKPPRGPAVLPPAPPKKPTGRKPGGQPGHPPHFKKLLPADRVDVIPAFPKTCSGCQAALSAKPRDGDPEPRRRQVAELPDIAARVIEYQAHTRTCSECGTINRAAFPADMPTRCLGPRLTAALGYFVASHGVSKRGVEEIAEDVFGVPIALGSVANLEREIEAALQPAYDEAKNHVQGEPVKHLDETGWKQAGKKRWLWAAATSTVAVFLIDRLRNAVALAKLLGTKVAGILCSDRWTVYDEHPIARRQICWAHLKRNFEKLQERGGSSARFANQALEVTRQVFEAWHLYRGGGKFEPFDETIAGLMLAFLDVIHEGKRSRDARLRRFCTRLLTQYCGLWTFAVKSGVEPTNNHAERVLRRAVLWRRRSFGCASDSGCRFVERALTAVQTLRLQNRSVLQFLHETLTAHRAGIQGPSLIQAAANG